MRRRKSTSNLLTFSQALQTPTKVQRESVALAEERGLSIEYLEIVNKIAKKLETRGAAWKLHAELIAFEGTPEEADAYCKKRITEGGGDKLDVGLFHPAEGPANLYETRFASDKLRTTRVPSLRSSAASALPCWL